MEKIVEQLRKIKEEIEKLQLICEEYGNSVYPDYQLFDLANDEIGELVKKHNKLVKALLI